MVVSEAFARRQWHPVERSVAGAAPLLADAPLVEDGSAIAVRLDAQVLHARASQQGLRDASEQAAARSPRVQRLSSDIGGALGLRICRVVSASGQMLAELHYEERSS